MLSRKYWLVIVLCSACGGVAVVEPAAERGESQNESDPANLNGASGNSNADASGASGFRATEGTSDTTMGASGAPMASGGTGGADGESVDEPLPACESQDEEGHPAPALGVSSDISTQFEGVITALGPLEMTIDTSEGVQTFTWVGPSLKTKFDTGESVTIEFSPAGPGGLGPWQMWTIVRSADATAATLDAHFWLQASTAPGSEIPVSTPADFPTVSLINTGCCRLDIDPMSGAFCTLSSLEASLGAEIVTVDQKTTGPLGEWSVTHWQGSHWQLPEYIVRAQATLLGPATAPP